MSIIGIDLGTTNSLVSIWKDGESILLKNALQEYLTPSIVGLDDDGKILVGKIAAQRLISHPELTVANFKRYMGTNKTFLLGNREFRPEELASFVIRALKEDAEFHLNDKITEAVISVPAYFNDTQRNATKTAGTLAGIKVERLINEPTAAAIAYGLHQKEKDHSFLVFDLGGGTFDISILEIFEGVMEVRATAGDNHLGGEDFLEIIIKDFLESNKLSKAQLTLQELNRLYAEAECCKKLLSKHDVASIIINLQENEISWKIDRKKFEKLAEALIQRLRKPIENALRDASIKQETLDNIILVGGATKMPLVRSVVSKMFGRLPTSHINPEEVVALGTAIQAGLKAKDKALEEVILTDICPYSLGIGICAVVNDNIMNGQFLPIIERNTVVPVSRMQTVSTVNPYQKQINLEVFQGESRIAKNNILLGSFSVNLKPSKELQDVDIRFTYNINGILEVELQILTTKEKINKFFVNNSTSLTTEMIEKSMHDLAKLKIHPRDQAENRMILARAERFYEELLGEARECIGYELNCFQLMLEKQNVADIKVAAQKINNLMNELEEN